MQIFLFFMVFAFLYVFCDESLVIWDEKPESNLRYLGRWRPYIPATVL